MAQEDSFVLGKSKQPASKNSLGNGQATNKSHVKGREYLSGVVVDWSDFDAAFFPDFATDGFFEGFAWFRKPARQE